MSKLSKKAEQEKSAMMKEIAKEVSEKYLITWNVEKLADKQLYDEVIKLVQKQEVPFDLVMATFKFLILNLYFLNGIEERGLKIE